MGRKPNIETRIKMLRILIDNIDKVKIK